MGRGDYPLREWAESGLLRALWVRLAKIACLEKRDITRRLGRLTDHDRARLTHLWRGLYAFAPPTR
jgi:hypothetical protein